MANGDSREIVPRGGTTPTTIHLGPIAAIDLSFLPEAERTELIRNHARDLINIQAEAQRLHVDVSVLKATLDQLAGTTRDVSESGNAVTVAYAQTTKIGRTEIKMGNTEEARSGKLSKSQTGERDWTPYYIFAAIAAVVLIAFLFAGGRH